MRAAAGITGEKEFIVLGSQSILGKFPDAPHSLRHSMEVDIYPKEHPELAELINGCLGEFSAFHTTFDYYADGVSPTTAILPRGWKSASCDFPMKTQTELSLTASIPLISPTQSWLLVVPKTLTTLSN